MSAFVLQNNIVCLYIPVHICTTVICIGYRICKLDEQNNLTEVVETKNIIKTADGAEADGVAIEV